MVHHVRQGDPENCAGECRLLTQSFRHSVENQVATHHVEVEAAIACECVVVGADARVNRVFHLLQLRLTRTLKFQVSQESALTKCD